MEDISVFQGCSVSQLVAHNCCDALNGREFVFGIVVFCLKVGSILAKEFPYMNLVLLAVRVIA